MNMINTDHMRPEQHPRESFIDRKVPYVMFHACHDPIGAITQIDARCASNGTNLATWQVSNDNAEGASQFGLNIFRIDGADFDDGTFLPNDERFDNITARAMLTLFLLVHNKLIDESADVDASASLPDPVFLPNNLSDASAGLNSVLDSMISDADADADADDVKRVIARIAEQLGIPVESIKVVKDEMPDGPKSMSGGAPMPPSARTFNFGEFMQTQNAQRRRGSDAA